MAGGRGQKDELLGGRRGVRGWPSTQAWRSRGPAGNQNSRCVSQRHSGEIQPGVKFDECLDNSETRKGPDLPSGQPKTLLPGTRTPEELSPG